ncbi:amidase [Gardnerella vaginalis]|nr:amidase [Gardnerella vaginalis]RIY19470.1 amidase [Gardnerella vaginalis]
MSTALALRIAFARYALSTQAGRRANSGNVNVLCAYSANRGV